MMASVSIDPYVMASMTLWIYWTGLASRNILMHIFSVILTLQHSGESIFESLLTKFS